MIEFATAADRARFLEGLEVGLARTGRAELDRLLDASDETIREELAQRSAEYMRFYAGEVRFLSLVVAENCNLGCSYCIAGSNMEAARAARTTRMPWAVAQVSLDWFFTKVNSGETVLNFTGGEPLLNWPVVARSVEYVHSTFPQLAASTQYTINTNATLITQEIAEFLARHKFAVATSLDGSPTASDLVRITRKGQLGVSGSILEGWDRLAEAGLPVDGFMATFNDRNYDQLNASVIDFAVERDCRWVRVDCDVIHLLERPVSETVERLWEVYQAGQAANIVVEGFWSTPAKNLIDADYSLSVPFFCGAVSGETLSVHPDGRLSACGFSAAQLGQVSLDRLDRDFDSHLDLVASHLPGARSFCHGCEIEGLCAGGCNIALEESKVSGSDAAVQYNCEVYREMSRRLLLDSFDSA